MDFLLHFYSDSFETLQMFRSWSDDVHIVLILSSDNFCHSFCKINLVTFPAEVNRYSNSFDALYVFKSWSEDVHIVKISPSDYFCHFFHKKNLVIFPAEVNRY